MAVKAGRRDSTIAERVPTEFHRSVHPEKYVVTLDVSMDHLV